MIRHSNANALEAVLEAVWLVDQRTLRIQWVNAAACELLGMGYEQLVGLPVVELAATPEDLFFWEDVAAGVAHSIHSDTLLRCADGLAIPVERKVSRVVVEPGEGPVYLVGVRDQRSQRAVEAELETRLAEMRATLESTGDGILVMDHAGRVRNYNRRFVELWEVPVELSSERDDSKLLQHMASAVQDKEAYQKQLDAIALAPDLEANDIVLMSNGRMLERVTCPQISRSRPTGRVFSFRDLTERLEAQKRIETLAYTDALTGLPNRLMLSQCVNTALKTIRRTGGVFAVLFIDLDRFKNINDSLWQPRAGGGLTQNSAGTA